MDDWRTEPDDALSADVGADDLAVLIPTSGTTGRSKLVMQTHRAYAWAGVGFPYWMELTAPDRLMTSLPLFHINAPAYSCLGSLACGAGLVLLPRFSASGFLDAARRHGATEFNAIGAMLEILMRQPERPDDADTPLRLCYTGPVAGEGVAGGVRAALRAAGRLRVRDVRVAVRSDLAARDPPVRHARLGRASTRPSGRSTRPAWSTTTAQRLEAGGTGELLLRNPTVTPGYWGMPEETAAAIVDGWLHTGDLVTVNDDGTYTFVARKKEVLRRRGLNLSPVEVEEAIAAHPGVLEVAVVGVPSELTEEEVKAFVVAQARASAWTSPSCARSRPSGCRRSRCRGSGSSSTRCPARRPRGWPSTGCRPGTPATSTTRRTIGKGER